MQDVHVTMKVNGETYSLTVPARESLLEILRDRLFLTGVKEGCGHGDCGACLVIMDGKLVNSCLVLAGDLDGVDITTVEGLAGENGELHPLQKAFLKEGAVQCGYCSSGMILSAKALIDSGVSLTEESIREGLSGVICRCGTYPRTIAAVMDAAQTMRKGG